VVRTVLSYGLLKNYIDIGSIASAASLAHTHDDPPAAFRKCNYGNDLIEIKLKEKNM